MSEQQLRSAANVPPAVKPSQRKLTVSTDELRRRLTPEVGHLSKEVQSAVNDLERAIRAERDARAAAATPPPPAPPVAPPSPSGDNGDMQDRIAALENFAQDTRERLARIETKLEAKADKADLLKTEVRLILLGGGAWASLLFILAKGFKWF